MLRVLTEAETGAAVASWHKDKFVVLRDIVSAKANAWKVDLQRELEALEPLAPRLKPNPHSVYKQVMPDYLARTRRSDLVPGTQQESWNVQQVYEWPDLISLVQRITGWSSVQRIPLRKDGAFEINGKLNFYDARDSSRLDWHFDKVFNFRGRQVVCVLTLRNDWDAFADRAPPTLQVMLPRSRVLTSTYLGSYSMTMHDPDAVFHRVLAFTSPPGYAKTPWKRSVLVMRFTDDPTPQIPLLQTVGAWRYLARQIEHFVYVGDLKWCAICAFVAACLVAAVSVAAQCAERRLHRTLTK